jgi:site-specific DNA-cytosine methylase
MDCPSDRNGCFGIESDELVVDNFAGGGGASTGIEAALGRHVDIAINHSAQAIAMHKANHPQTHHYCEDVWHVDPVKACAGRRVGLAHFSPDCFPAGTMILTRQGYRAIEEIAVGDEVLTHEQRWRRVTATMSTVRPLLRLRGHGHPGLLVSGEHPFYARYRTNVWHNAERRYERTLGPAGWTPASELGPDWYWATPREFPSAEVPPVPERKGRCTTISAALLWLAGRYLADGWTRLTETRADLVITCGRHEVDALRTKLALWPRTGMRSGSDELAWNERETGTAYQFTAAHRGLVEWLRDHFGHGAAEKTIPGWALGMSEPLRRALLDGYLSGDGYRGQKQGQPLVQAYTVSKALAFGIKALAASLGYSASIYFRASPPDVIEGRKVNVRPAWSVRWRDPVDSGHRQTVRAGGLEWAPIREQEDTGTSSEVFNLSVEEDESYVADGIVVHNCTHFSRAKGGKPRSAKIRALAWVVIRWASKVRPRVIIMENVEEFLTWGPLDEKGYPNPKRAGQTFRTWLTRLRNLGYKVEYRKLNAANYGAPTTRTRLFFIARCDGQPIVWPDPTHGKGLAKPWRSAAEIIDWNLPCKSIFERKKPLAEKTLKRIAAGVMRYVVNASRPFIVPVTHAGGEGRVHAVDDPLRTVTGANRGELALVTPFVSKYHGGERGETRGQLLDEPIRTLDTSNRFALVVPTLVQTGYGERDGQAPRVPGLEKPLGTVVAGGQKHALVAATVAPFIASHYGSSVGRGMDEPVPTVTAGGGGHSALVAALITKHYGGVVGHGVQLPLGAITSQDHHALTTVVMRGIDERDGSGDGTDSDGRDRGAGRRDGVATPQQERRVPGSASPDRDSRQERLPLGEPEPPGQAVPDHGSSPGVDGAPGSHSGGLGAEPQGRQQGEQSAGQPGAGHSVREPSARLPHGAPPEGEPRERPGRAGQRTEARGPVVRSDRGTSGDRADDCVPGRAREVRAFLTAYYSGNGNSDTQQQSLFVPLHTVTSKARFGLVMVEGEPYEITDIGMRMLEPHELFAAQGFPRSYELAPKFRGRALTKTAQIKLAGNSVCPEVEEVLVRANLGGGHAAKRVA